MSSNYYSYDTPEKCPYCGDDCHADFVDIGIGMEQCGPYHCDSCGASEIGPELRSWYVDERTPILRDGHPFSEIELENGWYDPNKKKVSPYANTINGVLVDHKTAKVAYDLGILDEKKID